MGDTTCTSTRLTVLGAVGRWLMTTHENDRHPVYTPRHARPPGAPPPVLDEPAARWKFDEGGQRFPRRDARDDLDDWVARDGAAQPHRPRLDRGRRPGGKVAWTVAAGVLVVCATGVSVQLLPASHTTHAAPPRHAAVHHAVVHAGVPATDDLPRLVPTLPAASPTPATTPAPSAPPAVAVVLGTLTGPALPAPTTALAHAVPALPGLLAPAPTAAPASSSAKPGVTTQLRGVVCKVESLVHKCTP
jgi:hypothetical protein